MQINDELLSQTFEDPCEFATCGASIRSEFTSRRQSTDIDEEPSSALEESRKILAKFSLFSKMEEHKRLKASGTINFQTCYFCKALISLTNTCVLCRENFCGKHKSEVNHKCENLSKDREAYLNAKNQFKLRLREVKSKGR